MAETKTRHTTRQDRPEAVDALLANLDHPHLQGIAALRTWVCGADPSIQEGVKWNAPSWRTHDYFATTHLRMKRGFGLILHRGAKVKSLPEGGIAVPDPTGKLKWLAPDRGLVEFDDHDDLATKGPALQELLRTWITRL